jgi:hypothetical protein
MTVLAVLEQLDRDGRARSSLAVTRWPVRIGRAIDNDIVLDDPHVAPYHALLEADDGGVVQLLPLPSLNGVQVGRRHLAPGERSPLRSSDAGWTLGHTRMRLRLAGESLEPERRLQRAPGHAVTLTLVLLLWAWVMADRALHLDPGAEVTDWLSPLLAFPALLVGWCLAWALASKLFQHRFDFWPHLAVAVRFAMAIEVADLVLPQFAAITGWAWPSRIETGVSTALALMMVWSHARIVLPNLRRALTMVATAGYVAAVAVLLSLNLQKDDRWFGELYVSTLPPPSLLLARPVSREVFLGEAANLRARLDRKVQAVQKEQQASAEADEE